MHFKSIILLSTAAALSFGTTAADARSCHIVECQQVRAGEVCRIRACNSPQNLVCYSGRYTVGDGYRTWRGGSQSQCEQRCANDSNCDMIEYYYGNEGVKCNLYSGMPVIRWNSNHDATVCAWQ